MTQKNTKKSPIPTPLLSKDNLGHWSFRRKFRTSEWFGFVYCITRKSDGKFYIGKKVFRYNGLKKSRRYGKEHSWRTYAGSSKNLKDDINKLGKDAFEFEIIDLYKTKGGLYYGEVYLQMLSDSITSTLPSGEYASYNRVISAIKFVPHENVSSATKKYAAKIKRKILERNKKNGIQSS